MNTHSKARTTPWSRGLLVDRIRLQGWTVAHAAERASVSVRTGYKWLARARTARLDLRDRPSVPGRMPRLTDSARTDLIVLLRRCHASGPAIARQLEMPRSTVARVLKREGLGRWKPSREVVVRYQRQRRFTVFGAIKIFNSEFSQQVFYQQLVNQVVFNNKNSYV